ncbi:uncharacterized protein TNCV_681951 [Trichonephila clavipes]|nr:uncharacterized protein TNCV_681951 [Trichonephila clavipes]
MRLRLAPISLNYHITLTLVAAVAEWYRYRTVACFVTGSSPVPLKTRRVGQRCTLNLSRAETSSRWCGVGVREGVPAQVSSTSLDHGSKITWSVAKSPRVAEQCDVNIQSINQSITLTLGRLNSTVDLERWPKF